MTAFLCFFLKKSYFRRELAFIFTAFDVRAYGQTEVYFRDNFPATFFRMNHFSGS